MDALEVDVPERYSVSLDASRGGLPGSEGDGGPSLIMAGGATAG
eukprot:COSAG06_NODE_59308_length_274_cov_1.177143_1_plen_43_part_10